ncbi:hypothetical protein ABFX02_12G019900 [Erythranthe guttata]
MNNTMKPHYIIIFLIITSLRGETKSQDSLNHEKNRRILHQPLFPAISAAPPPPPPPPDTPEQEQPFSNEFPTGPIPDQWGQLPPPLPPPTLAAARINPVATQPPSSPAKKAAIGISSAILTLIVLSVLAFFLYKNRAKHSIGSHKHVNQNPQRTINEESRMPPPPSTFLYTADSAEASTASLLNKTSGTTTRPPPPTVNPPPLMSSSDEESRCYKNVPSSLPHSRRTSPKSRFSISSPDATNHVIIPPIKLSLSHSPTLLGPLQSSKTLPYTPKRASFSPSPKIERCQLIENKISKIPVPHPPPPPPPPPLVSTSRRYEIPKTYNTPLEVSGKMTSPNNVTSFDDEDKVRDTSDIGTVWDQLKSSSFKLNEDAMDSLFGRNSVKAVPKEATRKFVLPSFKQENRILDTKKSQNIAILLRALNVTREEVSEALLDGNPEGLDPELFETLVKMAPSKEEETKLKNCENESSKLGPAERFLRAILEIPFAFKRVEAMVYRANFDTEVKYLRKSFQTLEEASEELKNSHLFLKLLEAVLRTGNRMNNGTNRGEAKAFKLDTLLKLVDIKGTDGKTTLLHFVVQEIIRSEEAFSDDPANKNTPCNKSNLKFNEDDFKKQGLQVVSGLSKELANVKKAATMDSDVLSGYVKKLETGLQKTKQVLQYEEQSLLRGNFFDSMKLFLKEAGDEISRVKAEERKALSLVREVTQYFHGETNARNEGHSLRIFMVIRDFLSVLDNVCKDVGRMQDRTTTGLGRSFRISANAPLPAVNRYNEHNSTSSDDDSI